jgi:glycosyltransferase involved in cell wall biosynthesis
MRVLRIYHSAVVDEYRTRDRLLRLRHGHDLEVVAPPAWEEGGSLVSPGAESDVPLHIVGVRGRRDHPNLFWYRSRELRQIVRRVAPEIVDLHEEPYSLAAAGALRAIAHEAPAARVCIYTAQNLDRRYPPPFSGLERRALRAASAAYPCSVGAAERLRARGFRGMIHVLPLGVTVPPPRDRTAAIRRIGFVGRLEPYKGATLALRAFIAATRGTGHVMEIVGAGTELDALRSLAAKDADRIVFSGALSQAETLERIAGMDIVLIPSLTTPSWKEQFGRVAVQAMAAGAAVIASDSGSLREVIDDGGVLVPEGNLAALTGALRALMADPAQLAALSAQGRQRAIERFTWDAVAAGVDEMYRAMVPAAVSVAR